MSRRITQQTEIKEKDLAIQALNSAGITHRVHGDTISLMSGDFNNAVLDLKTGNITGDSDYGHSSSKFGLLRQHYSEAKVKADFLKNGTVIDSQNVNEEGDIVLMWHVG